MAQRDIKFINQVPKALQKALADGVAKTTAQTSRRLKRNSPVDTGRFRSSWFHVESSGMPDTDEVAPYKAPPKGREPGSGAYYRSSVLKDDDVDGTKNQLLINNLPYALRLCEQGWSQKVPTNWFQQIKQDWIAGKTLKKNLPPDLEPYL